MKRATLAILLVGVGCGAFPRDTMVVHRRFRVPLGPSHEGLLIGPTTNYIEIVKPDGVIRINPPR